MSGAPTTRVLVTGASGFLGQRIVAALEAGGVPHTTLSHRDPVASAGWERVTHVVNAAAVVPGPDVTPAQYWDGNVAWVERLLPHLAGRHVVHFGTVSAFYRVGAYQTSKQLGEALLHANAARFASLQIVPVPTLDDEGLVAMLAGRADAGERPSITRLRYVWCSPDEVARHVVDDLVGHAGGTLRTETRLLTERVRAVTDAPFDEGDEQDRTCLRDDWRVTNAEAHASFLALHGLTR